MTILSSGLIDQTDKLFVQLLGEMRQFMGRDVGVVNYSEINCPNCRWDPINEESAGVYKPDDPYPSGVPGPIPFSGGFCPVCVPKDTVVITSNGPEFIQHIKVGDKVLSQSGHYNTVKEVFTRQYMGKFVTIKTWGNSIGLTCTADHPVYVIENGNCKQKGRETKYCFGLGKRHKKCVDLTNIVKKAAKDVKAGDIVLRPIPKENFGYLKKLEIDWNRYWKRRNYSVKLPLQLLISKDLLRILGWYIAEGSLHHSRVAQFTLNSNEVLKAKEIAESIYNAFNLDSNLYFKCGRCSAVLSVNNAAFSRWIEKLCGKYAENKMIPEQLYNKLDLIQMKELIGYILQGDGHERFKRNTINLGTVSRKLAYQIYDKFVNAKFFPTITRKREKVIHGTHHQPAFTVERCLSISQRPPGRYQNENYLFSSVRKVKDFVGSMTVYNLNVEKEHSYVANEILVGNCNGKGKYVTENQENVKVLINWASPRDRAAMAAGYVEAWDVTVQASVDNAEKLRTADEVYVDDTRVNYQSMQKGGLKTIAGIAMRFRKVGEEDES